MNRTPILFLNVMILAICGLVYELLAGTLASYVLGDSVTQFSLVIGIYLFALGIGAWLSKFVDRRLVRCFVEVEFCVALLGGCSAPLLLLSSARLSCFGAILYGVVFGVGVLVGLELPLLMRILKDHLDFKELVSRVLAFDYVGALVASLLFPIFCMPHLGLIRTSLLFGMLNAAVGLWATWLLRPVIEGSVAGLRIRGAVALSILAAAMVSHKGITRLVDSESFNDPVVYEEVTPYQQIIITGNRSGFQLYLNGHLQFSSADEYRYHEALVHPALALAGKPRRVLVLGGGDGLALREILASPEVAAVTLVDLDPSMTNLSRRFRPLGKLNAGAFDDPRVEVVNQDAMIWLDAPGEAYDAAIIDFPDPSSFALGKLYTTRFYRLLTKRLTPDAAVGIQCTSPLFSRQSFWCIIRTLEASGFSVRPYHVAVPSFGVWGFALAARKPFEIPARVPPGRRFLTAEVLPGLFVLPADCGPVPVEINRLDNQCLVRYDDVDWKHWE